MFNRAKVAVIDFNGIIRDDGKKNDISFANYEDTIKEAFEANNIKAVCLNINSPGGSPAQSSLIANYIQECSEEYEIPVYAFINEVGASGGYFIACAASEIFATSEYSIVGSIGVIGGGFGFDKLIEKIGIERRMFTSGENKHRLDPFKPLKDEDVEWTKKFQGQIHDLFIQHVKDNRGTTLNPQYKDIFTGDAWLAMDACMRGLIDGIGTIKDVMEPLYGEDIKYVKFGNKLSFMDKLVSKIPGIFTSILDRIVMERFKLY